MRKLTELIRAIEERHDAGGKGDSPAGVIRTGWPVVDETMGGLASGVHEWLGLGERGGGETMAGGCFRGAVAGWSPPLAVLAHLAGCAGRSAERGGEGWIVWVGSACRPYGRALVRDGGRDRSLLERSIFVDPPTDATRLWSLEAALRCEAVAAVVGDGRRFDLAATRRLHLAARSAGAIALLARPPGEMRQPTAASTRWLVCHTEGRSGVPAWQVQLIHGKGGRYASAGGVGLVLEWSDATSRVTVRTEVGDRPDSASASSGGRRRIA